MVACAITSLAVVASNQMRATTIPTQQWILDGMIANIFHAVVARISTRATTIRKPETTMVAASIRYFLWTAQAIA